MKKAMILNEKDNAATVQADVLREEMVFIQDQFNNEVLTVKALDHIPRGHKIAVQEILASDYVIKYGCIIGKASEVIREGAYVHTHNLESMRGRGDLVGN